MTRASTCLFAALLISAPAVRSEPLKLVDGDLTIPALEVRGGTIALKAARPVRIEVAGINWVKGVQKKFTVRVVPKKEFDDFTATRVSENSLDKYEHAEGSRYAKTLSLEAGDWAIMVENDRNFTKELTVHVTVVVDPAGH